MIALADFLLARIAEDEAVAEATSPFDDDDDIAAEEWHEREELWDAQPHSARCGWRRGEGLSSDCTCGYPAHVLAECEAKRRIVSQCDMVLRGREHGMFNDGQATDANDNLRSLAQVYADHPDYQPDWAPTESR